MLSLVNVCCCTARFVFILCRKIETFVLFGTDLQVQLEVSTRSVGTCLQIHVGSSIKFHLCFPNVAQRVRLPLQSTLAIGLPRWLNLPERLQQLVTAELKRQSARTYPSEGC